jgi:hypothetical protein
MRSARVMGILKSLDPKANQLWLGKKFAAKARKRLVNWADFIGTKSHDIPPHGLAGLLEAELDKAFAGPVGCYNSSPRETMSNLVKVVAQLRQQRDEAQKQVDRLDQALAALGSIYGLRSRGRNSRNVGRKGRTMSAAARRRIAAAQRARWAKWKAAQKKK